MQLSQIMVIAPPTPPCFAEREQWAEYLLACQQTKSPTSPFKKGVYIPSFNFCSDCTEAHAQEMLLVGKCNPAMFRGTKREVVLA